MQSLDGSPPRTITPENVSFSGFDPVIISPDGKSVAVAGLDGKIVLYPLDNGTPRIVPKLAGGFAPLRWCPGNSLLVFRPGDVPVKILRVDVNTGEQDNGTPRIVPKLAGGFAPLRWCPGNSLLVFRPGDVPVKILRVDVNTGEQRVWKEWAPSNRTGLAGIANVRVGADCQGSAYAAQYNPSELWISDGLR